MSYPPAPAGRPLLTHVSHRAMATEFVVMLGPNCSGAVEVALQALELLDEIEAELTIYDPNSEISRLNRAGSSGPVCLRESTYSLLRRAVWWSEQTAGAFDVTAGPLVDVWGFSRRRGKRPTDQEIAAASERVGYPLLRFDDQRRTVAFAREGMSVNLGAIGKGDAIDRLAARLRAAGVTDFLIHGGQSSVLAVGDQLAGGGQGWAVGIAHPSKPRRRLTGIWLRNAALGTSGSGKQYFHHRGRRYGHVIDPRSGQPAGDLMSLTVITSTARDADACATGMFVAGSEDAKRLAPSVAQALDEELPMILVRAGERQDNAEMEFVGRPEFVKLEVDGDLADRSGRAGPMDSTSLPQGGRDDAKI